MAETARIETRLASHDAASVPLLRLAGITKRYGATLANDGVDLTVMPGEIHALLGENGAGKSTLVRIVCGVAHADAGAMFWQGREVRPAGPAQAAELGIGTVFQHFSLFETLTVAENIALGLRTREDTKALAARIEAVAARYGLHVSPHRHVHDLSVGERQRVEIVRCLLRAPRLLIMDEPTSVLTPQEAAALFVTLRRLAEGGCGILYIGHKLEEIRDLCHRATVLRAGRVSGSCDPRLVPPAAIAEMMVGGALPASRAVGAAVPGEVRLRARKMNLPPATPFGCGLHAIDFDLRGGEILGIAGVAGNGQTELLAALSGERQARDAGHLLLADAAGALRPAGRLGVAARRRLGLAFIPEERLGRGAVGEMSLLENALLTGHAGDHVRLGLIRFAGLRRFAAGIIERFRVKAAGLSAPASSLSGGNLQKFIVGREIGAAPRVLLAAHPTWGVDIGAALSIRDDLIALRDAGAAILVVSEDLAELFEISDRIAVLHAGRLSAPRARAVTTIEEVGLLMGGMTGRPADRELAVAD